jgi:hypothetical protein
MSDHISYRNTAIAVIEGYRRLCEELEAENEALRLLNANIEDLDALLRKLAPAQQNLRAETALLKRHRISSPSALPLRMAA